VDTASKEARSGATGQGGGGGGPRAKALKLVHATRNMEVLVGGRGMEHLLRKLSR